jgi:hypothetical protein
VISRIKAALGDTSFSAAWEGGRLLGVAHALEEARSTSVPTDAVAMGRHGSPCGAKSTMRSCPTASRKRISPVVDLSGQYRMGMRRGGPSCPRASV